MSVESRPLLSRADRRATILSGAARAFARSGFAATSMDDVAAAVGVSRLIVYRHFASKEDLYRAVLEQVSARLIEEFVGGHTRQERAVGVRALLTVGREDPDAFVLLWRHAAREPRFAAHAAEHRRLATEAARRVLSGALDDPLLERWAASSLVAMLGEAVVVWLEEGSADRDEEMFELLAEGTRAMIGAWARPRPSASG